MNWTIHPSVKTRLQTHMRDLLRPVAPLPTQIRPKLNPLKGIRVVLLDVYGTMLAAGQGEVGSAGAAESEGAAEALEAAGWTPLKPRTGERAGELLHREITAEHTRLRATGIAYPEIRVPEIWSRVVRALARGRYVDGAISSEPVLTLAVEYECRVNPCRPMPHLDTTLQALQQRNILLGIVSNAQFYTPLLLDLFPECGWRAGTFLPHLCIWSWQEREAKPSPRLINKALKRLRRRHHVAPGEVLYVGNDMLNDVAAAQAGGCQTALFAGDRRSLRLRRGDPRTSDIVPDAVITSLDQLPRLLA